MHLNDHSLRQLDDAYLRSLDRDALCGLSLRLLADLKEARDRLNQGPENSSRPPSSRVPWERTGGSQWSGEEAEDSERTAEPTDVKPTDTLPGRKPGKQPGAPGMGRTQVFCAHAEQVHYPSGCAGCGQRLAIAGAVAYTGFQAVDLHWGNLGQPGLTLWVVDHR